LKIPPKMKAAVLTGPKVLELREVETPRPGPVDVLIRVEACAVCSSDVSLIAKPWVAQPPFGTFIPGHEYAGTVVALGETVDEFKVGDRVAVEAHLGCMRCRNCRLGNYTACLNYGKKGHRANGFTTNGGFAQYVVNHVNTVVNNAGGALNTPYVLDEIEEKDCNLVVDINLKGAFLCCQAVMPIMAKQGGGTIVNISALAGHWRASLAGVQYTPAKAGVEGLTRQLAYDRGKHGIRVNAVAPHRDPDRGEGSISLGGKE